MNNTGNLNTEENIVKNQSTELAELAVALSNVQSKVEGIKKTSDGYNYKYADLNECWNAIRPLLAENNLCVIQTNLPSVNGITIRTTLLHSSNQWIAGEIYMHAKDPTNPHTMGGLNTYARRYALSGLIGLSPVEDDGASAAKELSDDEKKHLIYVEMKNHNWSLEQLKHYTSETFGKEPNKLNNKEFASLLKVIQGE